MCDEILHSSVSLQLPAAYSNQWRNIMADEDGRRAAAAAPGIARHYRTADVRAGGPLRKLLEDSGIAEVLITSLADRPLGLLTFLALYRTQAIRPVDETERLLTEAFTPHLVETRNTNWVTQLTRMDSVSLPRHSGGAITDREGVLHAADSSFHRVICAEWPGWQGARLPVELRRCVSLGMPYHGRSLVARFTPVSGLQLLES